jgi:hypothetical protein
MNPQDVLLRTTAMIQSAKSPLFSTFLQGIFIMFMFGYQIEPLRAHFLNRENSQVSFFLIKYSYLTEDSSQGQPRLVYWPDSLCRPEVLRQLMGDLPIEVDCVLRPEIYAMLPKWSKYPYQYAGRNSLGIDCSGLVCEIQRTIYGRSYQSGSKEIYSQLKHIQRHELMEGDMVFFKIRKNRISHIGLYLGSNKFLHATTKAGVIISDLDEPYYRKRYFGAGRDPKPPQFVSIYSRNPGPNDFLPPQ